MPQGPSACAVQVEAHKVAHRVRSSSPMGFACFRGVTDPGCEHRPIVTGNSRHGAGHPSFRWMNTVLANIKPAIVATYKAVRTDVRPVFHAELSMCRVRPSATATRKANPSVLRSLRTLGRREVLSLQATRPTAMDRDHEGHDSTICGEWG